MRLLVFLHGFGQTPQTWQEQVTALPPGFRAVAPWLRGTRPARDDVFTVAAAADDVLGLLNVHGAAHMMLVGASLGAVVALDAAVRAPETVSHLVLSGGQVHPPAGALRAQRWAFRAIPARRLAAVGVDKARFLAALRELGHVDYRDRLGRVRARTLVVCGESDRAGRPASETLAAGIPGARLELVAGAGANPHTEAPARFNELLYDFLKG